MDYNKLPTPGNFKGSFQLHKELFSAISKVEISYSYNSRRDTVPTKDVESLLNCLQAAVDHLNTLLPQTDTGKKKKKD